MTVNSLVRRWVNSSLMQGKIADMYSTWLACKALVYAVGAECDKAEHSRSLRKDAASAILYAAEKATWMAGETIQTLGGNGYINEFLQAVYGVMPNSMKLAPVLQKFAVC